MEKRTTVDEYIKSFPAGVQRILDDVRRTIRAAAPEAEETISYQMPALKQNGILVYYGAFKDHISLFPTGSGVEAFKDELGPYRTTKGTIHFPLDKPIPLELVQRIVRFRVAENLKKAGQMGYSRSKRPAR